MTSYSADIPFLAFNTGLFPKSKLVRYITRLSLKHERETLLLVARLIRTTYGLQMALLTLTIWSSVFGLLRVFVTS